MTKLLKQITPWAREIGMSKTALIALTKEGRPLYDAWDGKRLDIAHPAYKKWYEKHLTRADQRGSAEGLDPMHEQALAAARAENRWSVSGIRASCGMGYSRAKRVFAQWVAMGLVPKDVKLREMSLDPQNIEPPPPIRGKRPPVEFAPPPRRAETDVTGELPEHIEEVADMSLREIILRFGTSTAFNDYLKALKAIEDIHAKRLQNAEKEGHLIHRDIVRNGIIDTINTTHQRILTDGARTMSVRCKAIIDAGGTLIDIEDTITEQLASFIRPCKSKMDRVIRNA